MNVYIARNLNDIAGSRNALDSVKRCLRSAGVTVTDPGETDIPKSDFEKRFEFCVTGVLAADVVLLDATTKLGLGAGAEIMLAAQHGIPTFSVCPMQSYYRKQDRTNRCEWIHPFIFGLSTVFDTYADCTNAILNRISTGHHE